MHSRREDDCDRSQPSDLGTTPLPLTPADVEWACNREALRDDRGELCGCDGLEREQERLKRDSPDTEEDEDVDDEELVIACHDTVVQSRQRRNRVRPLRNEHCGGWMTSSVSRREVNRVGSRSRRGSNKESNATKRVGMKDCSSSSSHGCVERKSSCIGIYLVRRHYEQKYLSPIQATGYSSSGC